MGIAKEKNQFNDAMSVLAEENQKMERLREEIAMQESELADANSAFVDETRMATENRSFQRGVPKQEMQKNNYSSQRSNQNSGENRSAIFDRDLSNQEKQMGNYSSHDFNELNYDNYSANDLVRMNINSGAKSVRQRSMTSNSVSPITCSGSKKHSILKAPDSVTSLSRQVLHKKMYVATMRGQALTYMFPPTRVPEMVPAFQLNQVELFSNQLLSTLRAPKINLILLIAFKISWRWPHLLRSLLRLQLLSRGLTIKFV